LVAQLGVNLAVLLDSDQSNTFALSVLASVYLSNGPVCLRCDVGFPDPGLAPVSWEMTRAADLINGLSGGRDAEVIAMLTSRDAKIGSNTQFLLSSKANRDNVFNVPLRLEMLIKHSKGGYAANRYQYSHGS
jgi:hypothetical protein